MSQVNTTRLSRLSQVGSLLLYVTCTLTSYGQIRTILVIGKQLSWHLIILEKKYYKFSLSKDDLYEGLVL